MEIYAHRGNSGEAPENTLAAFRQVLDADADGVEFDVHLSRDGFPVVIHDESVQRTGGTPGAVGDLTLAELQRLDVGAWFGAAFAGERMPTLEATLEVFRGGPLRVNIELKTDRRDYPGIAGAVIERVQRLGMQRQVLVSSFNHRTLLEARTLAPELEYAVLTSDQMLEPWSYVRLHGFQAFHPRGWAVDEELVRRCHGAGIKVRPWVVDDPQRGAQLEAMGVDALITNHPRRFGRAGRRG
jgi:glycerophosphoryl diester phosphodiesterase